MPIDISGLDLRELTADERVDFGKGYQAGGDYQIPPPDGKYTVKVIKVAARANKEKLLTLDLFGEVVGDANGKPVDGAAAGYKISHKGQSVKKNQFRNGSNLGDVLAAFGVTFDSEPTTADYKGGIDYIEGRTGVAKLRWEGFCMDCQDNVAKGQTDFPLKGDGTTRNHVKACPTCNKDVLAYAKVAGWISTLAAK